MDDQTDSTTQNGRGPSAKALNGKKQENGNVNKLQSTNDASADGTTGGTAATTKDNGDLKPAPSTVNDATTTTATENGSITLNSTNGNLNLQSAEAAASLSSSADETKMMAERGGGGDSKNAPPAETTTTAAKRKQPEEPAEEEDSRIVKLAKTRLSKWAARLFDPNRPRGLVQAPAVIPLNDEFLQAFGKREKEHDEKMGVDFDIEREIEDKDEEEDEEKKNASAKKKKKKAEHGSKLKISNLLYTTSGATLKEACSKFGPVAECNLIMDKDNPGGAVPRSKGRAYVTFEDVEAAKACMEGLKKLEGRNVRIDIADVTPPGGNKGGGAARDARYWAQDISTKCFRCGKVGHMESECTNAPKAKPCPMCAQTDHDMRVCPIKQVCFRCGIPGHLSRNCNRIQPGVVLPPRIVCTVCFQSGHHKTRCRMGSSSGAYVHKQGAICLVCGRQGHFQCRDSKWTFGLQGVTCSNCGRTGHIGAECDRPKLELCSRNEDLGHAEIEAAEHWLTAEEVVEKQKKEQEERRGRGGRGRDRDPRGSRGRDRGRDPRRDNNRGTNDCRGDSMPPQQQHYRSGDARHGSGGNYHQRTSSMPPRDNGGNRRQYSNGGGGGMPPRDARHYHDNSMPPRDSRHYNDNNSTMPPRDPRHNGNRRGSSGSRGHRNR